MTCSHNTSTGKLTIKAGTGQLFKVLSDFQVSSIDPALPEPWMGWTDNNDTVISVDVNNSQSINEVLRNTSLLSWGPMYPLDTEFTSVFLDLLNVHNICIHCPNIGHYNSVGVRGESSLIQKVLNFRRFWLPNFR